MTRIEAILTIAAVTLAITAIGWAGLAIAIDT